MVATELEMGATELDRVQVELDKTAVRLKQLRADLEKGKAKLVQARVEVEDRSSELEGRPAESEKITPNLDGIQAELEDKEAELDQAQAQLDQAQGQLDQIRANAGSMRRLTRRVNVSITSVAAIAQLYVWLAFFATTRKSNSFYSGPGLAFSIFVICCVMGTVLYIALQARGFTVILGVGLLNAFLFLVARFAGFYYHYGTASNFTEPIVTRIDALYFTLGTFTTAGTGTISPISQLARSLVSIQMCIDLILVVFIATIAVTRLSERRSSRY